VISWSQSTTFLYLAKFQKMKNVISAITFVYCLLSTAYCQLKVTKSTNQKIEGKDGGVFMEYLIEFKDKRNKYIEVDSVKSIADGSKLASHATDIDQGYFLISFSFALQPPPKCKTCVETTPAQPNMTKGVTIYYRRKGKKLKCKVKEFVRLEDVVQP
jgi:hypothetical protein